MTRLPDCPTQANFDEDPLMFSAVYHFTYPSGMNVRSLSSCSTPTGGENSHINIASPHHESLSEFWYSGSNSLDTPTVKVEDPLVISQHGGLWSTSPVLQSCDSNSPAISAHNATVGQHALTSPTSSCFPVDLSNYVRRPFSTEVVHY